MPSIAWLRRVLSGTEEVSVVVSPAGFLLLEIDDGSDLLLETGTDKLLLEGD